MSIVRYIGLGLNHQLTLVDRPEANGVERSNAEVLGFITRVCSDERLIHKWSAPDVLPFFKKLGFV